MKTIILNQRKERDELLSRPYLTRRSNQDTEMLLSSHLIKLITGPRRVGKSTQALLMLRDRNFAYLNFDSQPLLDAWDANLVMRMLDDVYPGYEYLLLDEVQRIPGWEKALTPSRSPNIRSKILCLIISAEQGRPSSVWQGDGRIWLLFLVAFRPF